MEKKFCKNCGEKIPKDSLFCQKCGTRVLKSESSTKIDNPLKNWINIWLVIIFLMTFFRVYASFSYILYIGHPLYSPSLWKILEVSFYIIGTIVPIFLLCLLYINRINYMLALILSIVPLWGVFLIYVVTDTSSASNKLMFGLLSLALLSLSFSFINKEKSNNKK